MGRKVPVEARGNVRGKLEREDGVRKTVEIRGGREGGVLSHIEVNSTDPYIII